MRSRIYAQSIFTKHSWGGRYGFALDELGRAVEEIFNKGAGLLGSVDALTDFLIWVAEGESEGRRGSAYSRWGRSWVN